MNGNESHGIIPTTTRPLISVIVLNYNGLAWLPRCFESLEQQTIFAEIEIIFIDNASTDDSAKLAQEWLNRVGRGRLVQNTANLYFCGGNNAGASVATGEFLLFLNFDLWLESDCLEKLYGETTTAGADCASPLVLNYDDNSFQGCGAGGLDLFGLPTLQVQPSSQPREMFVAYGCSLLVRNEVFRRIGGFPEEFLMYGEESDVCWRVWLAGGKVMTIPAAKLHHRGSVIANPAGETKIVEARTNETKRFLANRNGILLLLKNAQHVLLLLLIPQIFLLSVEAMVSLVLVRRWSYVRKSYLCAIIGAFRMLGSVRQSRRQIRGFRQRGDFWMLRFLRLQPARWDEVKRLLKFGVPKVERK